MTVHGFGRLCCVTWGVLVLLALASYRLARLVTTDNLTAGMRLAAVRRWPARVEPLQDPQGEPIPGSAQSVPSWPVVVLNCTWCVGVWTSLGLALLVHFTTRWLDSWTVEALAWLAAATVVGFLSRLEA